MANIKKKSKAREKRKFDGTRTCKKKFQISNVKTKTSFRKRMSKKPPVNPSFLSLVTLKKDDSVQNHSNHLKASRKHQFMNLPLRERMLEKLKAAKFRYSM